MTYRAAIVDMGGVLEHNLPTGWVQRWEHRLGLAPDGLAAVVSRIRHDARIGRAPLADIKRRTAAAL
jgi:hypothetical protein